VMTAPASISKARARFMARRGGRVESGSSNRRPHGSAQYDDERGLGDPRRPTGSGGSGQKRGAHVTGINGC